MARPSPHQSFTPAASAKEDASCARRGGYGERVAARMRSEGWLAIVAVALLACEDEGSARDAGRRPLDAAASRDSAARSPEDAGAHDAGAFDAPADEDAGAPEECGAVDVRIVESCPPFDACGGALLEGERCYDGLCVEHDELLAPMLRYCALIAVESASGTIRGRASLSGGELAHASTTAIELTIRFPSECVVNGCDEVETLTRAQLPRFSVACAASDACRCALTLRETVDRTAPYSADPSRGVLTVGADDEAREHPYCAGADGALHVRGPAGLGAQRLAPPG